MRIKCDYCDTVYEDTLSRCPSCGAANGKRIVSDNKPRTIDELKAWYTAHHLPPEETTRFFIGQDYKNPRAFGIYKDDSGQFVVYKNKASGERAIRYKGKDEEYAVNELWLKLKDEIVRQKGNQNRKGAEPTKYTHTYDTHGTTRYPRRKNLNTTGKKLLMRFGAVWIAAIIFILVTTVINGKYNGYYNYGGNIYFRSQSDWYLYDSYYDDWYEAEPPAQYDTNNLDPYFLGRDYSDAQWNYDDIEFSDAKESDSYIESHSSSSDGYDWDSGSSWDSGGSDWSSDW